MTIIFLQVCCGRHHCQLPPHRHPLGPYSGSGQVNHILAANISTEKILTDDILSDDISTANIWSDNILTADTLIFGKYQQNYQRPINRNL